MRLLMSGLAIAVSLTAPGAFAQTACSSLDKGDLSVGQMISQAQQQQLMAEAPVGTLHCGRTGCTALASDGVSYSWSRDGRIVGKKIELSDPADLPAGAAGSIRPSPIAWAGRRARASPCSTMNSTEGAR